MAIDAIEPGHRLLIRQGDVAVVDGAAGSGRAVPDQSALTGEPMPMRPSGGDAAMSGAASADEPLDTATHGASAGPHAGSVRLVVAESPSKAPM